MDEDEGDSETEARVGGVDERLAGRFDRGMRIGGSGLATGGDEGEDDDAESDQGGTGVVMSQLRHFVIQVGATTWTPADVPCTTHGADPPGVHAPSDAV